MDVGFDLLLLASSPALPRIDRSFGWSLSEIDDGLLLAGSLGSPCTPNAGLESGVGKGPLSDIYPERRAPARTSHADSASGSSMSRRSTSAAGNQVRAGPRICGLEQESDL